MSLPWSTAGASRTVTYAAIADADGIKTSIATAVTQQTYSGVALNGARAAGYPTWLPQNVSVTSSASVGSYNLTGITFTGTDVAGEALTETLTLTAANGNETVVGTKAFANVTSIVVAAMADTNGAFTFGMRDIIMLQYSTVTSKPLRQVIRVLKTTAATGNCLVTYGGGVTDTLPMAVNVHEPVQAIQISGTATTTALPLVVYL